MCLLCYICHLNDFVISKPKSQDFPPSLWNDSNSRDLFVCLSVFFPCYKIKQTRKYQPCIRINKGCNLFGGNTSQSGN